MQASDLRGMAAGARQDAYLGIRATDSPNHNTLVEWYNQDSVQGGGGWYNRPWETIQCCRVCGQESGEVREESRYNG